MERLKFESIVSRLSPGQLIEIVQEDPSGTGFFTDEVTGDKQQIKQPYYFSARTNISHDEPGISVTTNKNYVSGQLQAPYLSLSHKSIKDIHPIFR